jgi:ATP-dependent DNA helicase RecG
MTYAGLMFSDECPLLQSRVFCTHWDGLDKSGGLDDAVDDKEFEGDLISQLTSTHEFIKMNSKVRWKKAPDHRINKPDYADRAVFEALANALMHRDYTVIGSEVHVDMYDDRLEIYSPGGMPDGTLIQQCDIEEVPSMRRNPIIAEIFHRLGYIERRGSGLQKINNATADLYGYTENFAPQFKSTQTAFYVVLKNMNYDLRSDSTQVSTQVTAQDGRLVSLLEYCSIPRTRDEMQQFYGVATREYFRKHVLKPLLQSSQLAMTIPDKPNSSNQKYVRV